MDYNEAYARALRLLNIRFLSEGELRRKLQVRGTGNEVIDDVLETLRQEHFVDDQCLAEAVYAYYARKGQYGHRYIVSRLQKRQLPVPENTPCVDEMTVAEQLVSRRFKEGTEPRKIARFLQYRGFSPSIIREILSGFGW